MRRLRLSNERERCRHRSVVRHTGGVGDMAEVNHPRAGRDGALEEVVQLVEVLRRRGDGEGLQDDAVAALALAPGGEHPGIVLRGRQDLVARLKLERLFGK